MTKETKETHGICTQIREREMQGEEGDGPIGTNTTQFPVISLQASVVSATVRDAPGVLISWITMEPNTFTEIEEKTVTSLFFTSGQFNAFFDLLSLEAARRKNSALVYQKQNMNGGTKS